MREEVGMGSKVSMSKECLSIKNAAIRLVGTGIGLPETELAIKGDCIHLKALPEYLEKYTSDYECPPESDLIPEIWITDENSQYIINHDPSIGKNLCINCGVCKNICPAGAIELVNGKTTIISSVCINCAESSPCQSNCPVGGVVAGQLICLGCGGPIIAGTEEVYHNHIIERKSGGKATYYNYENHSSVTCSFCGTTYTKKELFNYFG